MITPIRNLWLELAEIKSDRLSYRSLGENITSLRAAYDPIEKRNILLIEVPNDYQLPNDTPKWRGMTFGIKKDKLGPHQHGTHLSISLAADKHQQILRLFARILLKF